LEWPPSGGHTLQGIDMVTKEELKKAIKEVEKSESKKPETSRQTLTLKQQVKRIAEGDNPEYHLK